MLKIILPQSLFSYRWVWMCLDYMANEEASPTFATYGFRYKKDGDIVFDGKISERTLMIDMMSLVLILQPTTNGHQFTMPYKAILSTGQDEKVYILKKCTGRLMLEANNARLQVSTARPNLVLAEVDRVVQAKDSEVCKITRADGSSRFHGDIQALLRDF
ncbi:hypothetical protein Tco_0435812 [Tanacetum coccineum]